MSDEIESELERLKRAKVVSEQTAQVYLSEVRKKLEEDKIANSEEK